METVADKVATIEWERWRALCGLLKASGAVTEADLKSPAGDVHSTPGLRLIGAIKAWAEALAELKVVSR